MYRDKKDYLKGNNNYALYKKCAEQKFNAKHPSLKKTLNWMDQHLSKWAFSWNVKWPLSEFYIVGEIGKVWFLKQISTDKSSIQYLWCVI